MNKTQLQQRYLHMARMIAWDMVISTGYGWNMDGGLGQ